MHFYLYLTVVCLCHRYKILEIILYLIIGVCPAAVAFMMVCKFRTFLSCKSVHRTNCKTILKFILKIAVELYKIIFHWIFVHLFPFRENLQEYMSCFWEDCLLLLVLSSSRVMASFPLLMPSGTSLSWLAHCSIFMPLIYTY